MDKDIKTQIHNCYNDIVDLYRNKPVNIKAERIIRTKIENLENELNGSKKMNEAKKLNTITYNSKKYYVDIRLKEFRAVEPPLEIIPFNSATGKDILNHIYDLIGIYY